MSEPCVIAATVTYRRPEQLGRLLESLATERGALKEALIVDNGGDVAPATRATAAALLVRVVTPDRNLGCGGGVAVALREAFCDPRVTHVWLFDDDAEATPGALASLLEGLALGQAEVAVPLNSDAEGRIGWFPGPLAQPAWDVIRRPGVTPATFRAECGMAPLAWSWAPWTSLLVTRRAVEEAGMPRDDYWFQGEDLEWTLRLSARLRCVLVPAAECRHFPPAGSPQRTQLKGAAMLQNNLYTGLYLPHGRRALRHAPGNLWRFVREHGLSLRVLSLAWIAHWNGAVRGLPAGAHGGNTFQRRWERMAADKDQGRRTKDEGPGEP